MSQAMAVPALIYTVMLFGPGLLCLRCAHLPRPWAVCCAPIVSISLVSLVGEFCSVLDIPATPFSIFVPVVCLPLLVHLALRAINGHADSHGSTAEVSAEAPIVWWLPLLFAVVGLIICNNLFISELPTPDSFIQNYDMQHHLNVTQSLIDANLVTSRGINLYMSESDAMLMPFGYGSFYPAAWYGQCSLLAQATGVSVPIAINVTLAITLGIAYPIGMCAFASQVFGKHGQCVTFAAFTCIGFAMFPWCLLIFGPLYPNLVGFSLMPASMALCIRAIQSTASKQGRALAWIVALLALIGQALLHPNTLFSMYVILIPFVAQTIYTRVDHKCCARKAVLAVSGFLLACLVFWTICYKSPAFSGVIGEFWPRYAYPWQEVINILSQTYTLFFFSEITAQVLLGSLVVIGFIRMVYDEKTRWLSASYILTCAICFVCAVMTNATVKRFIAGFWYTDAMRVTAAAIIVASLIAAAGMDWLYDQICLILDVHNKQLGRATHRRLVLAIMSICFIVLNFMPGFNWPGAHAESTSHIVQYRMEGREYESNSVKTTFGDYRQLLRDSYMSSSPLDDHELVFLEEVSEVVGTDVVINNPYDGSTLAYGTYGMRVYYRKAHGYGTSAETSQSLAIRTGLCNIASDARVRQAVDDIDAHYVLIMDDTFSASSFLNLRGDLDPEAYVGISQITEDTPGFTEVLSSGSCHLYRID